MTNNSEGLTPTVRPQLGLGFGRALPAPFGFDNGYYGAGTDDYFLLPSMQDNPTQEGCIEFFLKKDSSGGAFGWLATDASSFSLRLEGNYLSIYLNGSGSGFSALMTDDYNHCVFNWDVNGTELTVNNYKYTGFSYNNPFTHFIGKTIAQFSVGADFYTFGGINVGLVAMDEFRIYNRKLTKSEIGLNYNGGIGNNPCVTENLTSWLKFQKFEMLDFSPLQDNSDLRLGVRSHSGQQSHAIPYNMDTNPASPNYVLKPF